jgi:hypothetical protein
MGLSATERGDCRSRSDREGAVAASRVDAPDQSVREGLAAVVTATRTDGGRCRHRQHRRRDPLRQLGPLRCPPHRRDGRRRLLISVGLRRQAVRRMEAPFERAVGLRATVAPVGNTSAGRGSKRRTVVIGALIGIFAVFDAIIIGLPILGLAAWLNPLVVFVVALISLVVINIAACTWVDRQWDAWIVGSRFEHKMQKIRIGQAGHTPDRLDEPRLGSLVRLGRRLPERGAGHRAVTAHQRTPVRRASHRGGVGGLLPLYGRDLLPLGVRA